MNNQFSENLKKIRKENNLSQEQLADELGVSRQAISKWESAISYPEMDKIIMLCNKFNLNIDDLLHKDIKEVKGEEESKKKINNIIDDFLKFITSTISLLSNMNFKSKIKCLLEQVLIIFILFIISQIINSSLTTLFSNILRFLPPNINTFIINILDSILTIALIIISIIIIIHIFKTRYLDYYEKLKDDNITEEEFNKEKNISLNKNNANKIIIRDPKHSEYKFINTLLKIIIFIIKLFFLWISLFIAFTIIFLFASLIASFLVSKTGLFFIGLIVTILSSATIAIIILLLILNFVFNRKNNKKKIISTLIISIVTFGIGCGLIFTGTLSFNIKEYNESDLKIITKEYDMKEDTIIDPYNNNKEIEYIESNNNNIKIEYKINKYCKINTTNNHNEENYITAYSYCDNPIKLAKQFIKNMNNKTIVPMNDSIEKITVYTTKNNIDKLKNNWNKHLTSEKENNERLNNYEQEISNLTRENNELRQEIDDLKNKEKEN